MTNFIERLFKEIEHGDDEHRAWLKQALVDSPAIKALADNLVKENVELRHERDALTGELVGAYRLSREKSEMIRRWRQEADTLYSELNTTKAIVSETMVPYARQLEAELTATKERLVEVEESFLYLCKWVERGMFDPFVSAKDAIKAIAYHPTMPWKSGRWDVDYKPYAHAFYRIFPSAQKESSQ